MALCIIALPVLLILGIFSATHRKLAWEALDCVWRKTTFRPCRTGLDERIQSAFIGRIMRHNITAAKFINQNFTILSWVFVILLLLSSYSSAIGAYNYWYYGNCNGPESTGFCIADPTGKYTGLSENDIDAPQNIVLPSKQHDDPIIGDPNAKLTIIEFGCYTCPYTEKAEPTVKEILKEFNGKVNIQFKTVILPNHEYSFESALAANCALEQDKFNEYHKRLFETIDDRSIDGLYSLANELSLDSDSFSECMQRESNKNEVMADSFMAQQAGVIGTPTFFIEDEIIVGPKPFRTFETIIKRHLD